MVTECLWTWGAPNLRMLGNPNTSVCRCPLSSGIPRTALNGIPTRGSRGMSRHSPIGRSRSPFSPPLKAFFPTSTCGRVRARDYWMTGWVFAGLMLGGKTEMTRWSGRRPTNSCPFYNVKFNSSQSRSIISQGIRAWARSERSGSSRTRRRTD